jgi:hypothetical protein
MIIEKILWFEGRLGDELFNWELDDATYSTMRYMLEASNMYPVETIKYSDALKRLRVISEKYNSENVQNLCESERQKVNRMFRIIAVGSTNLIAEINNINANKLILEVEEFFSVEENDKLQFNVLLALGLMGRKDKNIKAIIDCLISATNTIRELGGYTNDVQVGLHGNVSINEL